jgi:hypothetical protein
MAGIEQEVPVTIFMAEVEPGYSFKEKIMRVKNTLVKNKSILFLLVVCMIVVPVLASETNTDEKWTQTTANAEWSARIAHTSVAMPDGSIVLMGGDDGNLKNDVWRSTDNGATWTQQTAHAGWTPRSLPRSVAMPDGSIVLIGGDDGNYKNDVWRSTDNGVTWTLQNASAGWTLKETFSTVVMPDGSIIVSGGGLPGGYIQFNDVWRSTDNGATWTQQTASAGWGKRTGHSSVAMPDGSIVLTGGFSFSHGGCWNDVWRSTDNGATWTQQTADAGWSKRYFHNSVAMPDGSIVLTGGGINDNPVRKNDVWRSTDNGVTWSQITPSPGWSGRYHHTTVAMPDGSIVLMGGDDGSYRNDVWQLMPVGSSVLNPDIYTNMRNNTSRSGLLVTKTISPKSLKRGTDARIIITVLNQGPGQVHDIEIVDANPLEFSVVKGITQYATPMMEPNETRILTYTVTATKPGSFRLNRTAVMYADVEGNYHITYSNYEKVEVLQSLISPASEKGSDNFFQNIFVWFNGLSRNAQPQGST